MVLTFAAITALAGCQKAEPGPTVGLPTALSDVSAARLNYRYEPDVPPPDAAPSVRDEQNNAAVQAHFESSRPEEFLDRTLTSPDKARVLAIYHRTTDLPSEFRLDMYSPDGSLLNKVTADMMAVHFPDTIVWSPDSANLAFVAMLRGAQDETGIEQLGGSTGTTPTQTPGEPAEPPGTDPESPAAADANTNAAPENANVDSPGEEATPAAEPTPVEPTGVLTFRTEQIYLCDADGANLKPLTQNEGLIYFYYTWSPDSTMLLALAATAREWQYLEARADQEGQIFVPVGRPRVIEKTGRERRLDDGLTAVQPVWSPDSSKIAGAYEHQIRIYDAGGAVPTQAAIPLRNSLLLSSQAYDLRQQRELAGSAPVADANAGMRQPNTLPDPNTLVSFNPIVAMTWPSDDLLYFQTAFIKRMKNEAESVSSFPRWHRLIFSPQPLSPGNQ